MKELLLTLTLTSILFSCVDNQRTKEEKIIQKEQKNYLTEKFGDLNCYQTNGYHYACENKLLYCIKYNGYKEGGLWCMKKSELDQ